MRSPHCSIRTILLLLLLSGVVPAAAVNPAAGAAARPSFVNSVRLSTGATEIDASPAPSIATPHGVQNLTIAGPSTAIASLDPALVRDSDSSFLARQIFTGLIRFNDKLEPVPALADKIQISADGLHYGFHLDLHAAFLNGQPIAAADFVFSLNRAVDPSTANGDLSALGGPTFLSNIKGFDLVSSGASHQLSGVTIIDDHNLTIDLVAPDSAFLMKLASTPASIVDQKDVQRGADWWTHPNSSGPFGISEYSALDHLTLTPNSRYYEGPATLQTVTVLLGSKALNPFNLYQVGGVDVANVGLSGVDRVLAPDAGYVSQLRTTPQFSLDFIALNPTLAPLNDPLIRKAIALAFPSAKVANVTLNGHASSAQGVIPNGMLGQNWAGNVDATDVVAAKDAIAHSTYGSADKVPVIQIYVSGGGSSEALRDSIAETIGLKIDVISMTWTDFIGGLSGKAFPGFELYWTADFPDPESILTVLFGTGRPDNYLNYSNLTMDALLVRASAEIDPTQRAKLYLEAQQLLIDDHVVIPILFDVGYTLVNPAVKGLTFTPMGIVSLGSVWMEH